MSRSQRNAKIQHCVLFVRDVLSFGALPVGELMISMRRMRPYSDELCRYSGCTRPDVAAQVLAQEIEKFVGSTGILLQICQKSTILQENQHKIHFFGKKKLLFLLNFVINNS